MDAIIVPCTQEKIWDSRPDAGPVAARDAYTKPVFARWRAHAEQSGNPWFVLSTKYGLITPDTVIERYNVPISAAVRDAGLLQRLREQGEALDLRQYSRLVLLDWEKFQPLVKAAVGNHGVSCALRRIAY